MSGTPTRVQLDPLIVDGPAIAHSLKIPAGTLRRWAWECAQEGYTGPMIRPRGRDARRRTLYDWDEVCAFAATRGIEAS